MKRLFIKKLYELYVVQQLRLDEALLIIKENKNFEKKRIRKAGEYIYQQMEEGHLISNAFNSCPHIDFGGTIISFLALAEKTGDLRLGIEYLYKKLEREHSSKRKIWEVSIYPIFIMLISVLGSFFLVDYMEYKNFSFLIKMILFMGVVSISVFLGIAKVMGENQLYEAFLAIDFLIKAGIGIAEAVGCGVQLVGVNTKLGKKFQIAKERLEFGVSLENALQLGKTFQEGFYYAEKGAGKTDIFGKMACWLNQQDENRRKICTELMEPVFVLLAGGFMFALILKIFVPFMNPMNFM